MLGVTSSNWIAWSNTVYSKAHSVSLVPLLDSKSAMTLCFLGICATVIQILFLMQKSHISVTKRFISFEWPVRPIWFIQLQTAVVLSGRIFTCFWQIWSTNGFRLSNMALTSSQLMCSVLRFPRVPWTTCIGMLSRYICAGMDPAWSGRGGGCSANSGAELC
jgi:hypothetical protein